MTKEIHQQQSQPLNASMVGLALLLGWMVVSHQLVSTENQGVLVTNWFHTIYYLVFRHLIYWKLFTLIAFIFGIRAYVYTETESSARLFYIRSLMWIVTAVLLSFINLMALAFIPLIVFGTILFSMRDAGTKVQFISLIILLFILIGVSWFSQLPNFRELCFSGFLMDHSAMNFSQILVSQLMLPSNQVAWLFGFMVMIIGYAVGKAKWLLNYHFHYGGLRQLFFISIGLVALWGCLVYLNYYHFLLQYNIGRVFYLLDTLSIQLITLFIYLFVLIYLENYRIGILLNRILAAAGKLWFFNLLMLFVLVFIANGFQLFIPQGVSVVLGLSGFTITSLVSYLVLPNLPKKLEFLY